jgi:hypothetical protein
MVTQKGAHQNTPWGGARRGSVNPLIHLNKISEFLTDIERCCATKVKVRFGFKLCASCRARVTACKSHVDRARRELDTKVKERYLSV